MAKQSKQPKDACINCGHTRHYHAIAEQHELGTTHCTRVSDQNEYCNCKEYKNNEMDTTNQNKDIEKPNSEVQETTSENNG